MTCFQLPQRREKDLSIARIVYADHAMGMDLAEYAKGLGLATHAIKNATIVRVAGHVLIAMGRGST